MNNYKTFISETLLLLCAIIWGLSYIAQKSAMVYMGPLSFLFFRYALGSASLIPFSILSNKSKSSSKKTSLLTFRSPVFWKRALFCGAINLTATGFVQIGLCFTDASKAGFLTSIYILIVPLISIFLYHTKHNINVYIGIIVCTIGLYFLSFDSNQGFVKGDLVVLCSSLFYAIHILLWDKYAKDVEPISFVIVEFAFASIIAFCSAIIFESLSFDVLLKCLPAVLFAGVFASGLSYSMQLYAQRHVNASISALLMSSESVFAVLGGVFLLHETLNQREILGACLIFFAIIFIQGNNILKRNLKKNKNVS